MILACAVALALSLAACEGAPSGSEVPGDTIPGGGGPGPNPGPSTGDPAPDANDRLLVDTRQRFQQAQNIAHADCAILGIAPSACQSTDVESEHVGFTTNMDGQGTHAVRMSWRRATSCTDDGVTWPVELQAPYPKRIYMQWKMRLGRTATGGGLGALNSFDITNENCGNAGRKMWLTLRDVPDRGGAGRLDFIWPGPAPVQPRFETGVPNLRYNQGHVFQPQDHVGETITHTIYYQAESSPTANDGVVRLWINGLLMMDYTGLDMGAEGFHRFQFPNTFRAPIQDQTEYWWGFVAWEPVP